MKKKKWSCVLLILAFVLLLAACQQNANHKTTEEKVTDPKQLYTTAFQKTLNAKTYDSSIDADINIDTSNLQGEYKEIADVINNAKLTVDAKVNEETKQSELVFKGKFSYENLSMDFNVPVYLDEDKQRGYIKLDSMLKSFGIFLGTSENHLKSVKNKYLEFSLEEDQPLNPHTEERLKRKLQESLIKAMGDIPQDNFKKSQQGAAQKVTLSLSNKGFKTFIMNYFDVSGEALKDPLTNTEMNQLKEDFLEKINFKKLSITATMDNKEYIQNVNTDILFHVDHRDFTGDIGCKLSTSYKNINGDVTFKYNPKKDQILTEDEFEELMTQATEMN
ncbi:hypothetical protein PJ311_14705 [Bacillus sp. CLL-7-23]|uniref:Lipoprotein n=1 Tax=Bacillus changyiensis TaxID=3004103 RepID=A0ABT4X6A9_9BACI|nr:hypothetical protein [Bacillus changyiensis]MDA7027827.1 hypothetical protein [Bacillus changyiensis]